MEIIKHGKKPEDSKLYFICYNCHCEYSEYKSHCEWKDYGSCYECGFVSKCPDCSKENKGTSREAYLKRISK